MRARTPRLGATAHKLWWWITDYGYAGWRQVASLVALPHWGAPPRTPMHNQPAPTDQPHPGFAAPRDILVLPGVYERWGFVRPLIRHLRTQGHRVHVVRQLWWNTHDIPTSAAIVARFCAQQQLDTVAIVAHSKGGLIGKHLMLHASDTLHGANSLNVTAMCTVATPFSGSRYARYIPVRALRHFSAVHPELAALGQQIGVNERITSIYARFDPHIPERSELVGAHNYEIPTGGHFRILADRRVLDLIAQWCARLPC